MLAGVALPVDHRREFAFRRFPPGCGRHHNASAGPAPHHPLPMTAAAAAKTKPPLLNASSTARGTTKTAPPPPQPKPAIHAAFPLGTAASSRGVVNGGQAAAAETVRRASAVRRYPPGCGRGVAVCEPPASVGKAESEASASETKPLAAVTVLRVSAVRRYPPGCGRGVAVCQPPASVAKVESQAGASKPLAAVGNGDDKARASDQEMMRKSALDHAGDFNSNGGMKNGGDGDADAQEEGSGKPWVVTGIMAVPFLPWAQYGTRSHRPSPRFKGLNLL